MRSFWPSLKKLMSVGDGPSRTGTREVFGSSGQEMPQSEAVALMSLHFDADFYLRANGDVAAAGIDPFEHFCIYGWKEGRNPTSRFSCSDYVRNHPEISDAGINPFWHYLKGATEANVIKVISERVEIPPSTDGRILELESQISLIRPGFDEDYYRRNNPDVVASGVVPIEHFVMTGWREGRDPSPQFSVSYYLESNPDVASAGINPFWHYHVAGKAEGRLPLRPGGYRGEMLRTMVPLEEVVASWRSCTPPDHLMTRTEILDSVRKAAGTTIEKLMISVGHDNYRTICGGVQYCVQREEETATDLGVLYLNLHPMQPLPRLAHRAEAPDLAVTIILAGSVIGTAPMSVVVEAVGSLRQTFRQIDVVIHHLLGHNPEQVADMVLATGTDKCWLWLHDFFTLCPSYVLQRNNVSFCGAPSLDSNACSLCLYGVERIDHHARMKAFFDRLSVQVVAPSRFAADFWSARAHLKTAGLHICPHMSIDWKRRKGTPAQAQDKTVAFVGYPAPYKGWPLFERLVAAHAHANSGYKFVYFGTSPVGSAGLEIIPVHVTAEDPDAMIRAISERGVDIVLHWASCAETFSFSTHEAIASGACVLTNPISGNVAVTVQATGQGAVLTNQTDLESFFRDGRADSMVTKLRAQRQKRQASLSRSKMVFSVLDEAGER